MNRWKLIGAALLRPNLWATLTALITNAIQLSELSNAEGGPLEDMASNSQWIAMAAAVAREAREIRRQTGQL